MWRRALRILAFTIAGLAVLATVLLIVAQSSWGQERARRVLVSRAGGALNAEFDVGSLRWTSTGATLKDVQLTLDGQPLFKAESVSVRYRPWRMLTTGLVLEEVIVHRPAIVLVEDTNGWNINRAIKTRESPSGDGVSFTIDALRLIEGSVTVAPRGARARQFTSLFIDADISFAHKQLRAAISRATTVDAHTGLRLHSFTGDTAVGNGVLAFERVDLTAGGTHAKGSIRLLTNNDGRAIDIDMVGNPIQIQEVARYVPAVARIKVTPRISVKAKGTTEHLTVDVTMSSSAGTLTTQLTGRLGANDVWQLNGEAEVASFNIAPWFGRPNLASNITGRTSLDVTLPEAEPERLAVRFDARLPSIAIARYAARNVAARGTWVQDVVQAEGSGMAYGTTVRAAARWHIRRSVFGARGTFAGLDVRRLPRHLEVPALETRAGGKFEVEVAPRTWLADVTFDPSTIEGTSIAAGTRARLDARQPLLAYTIRGAFAGFDPDRFKPFIPKLPAALQKAQGVLNGDIDLNGRGTTLEEADATVTLDLKDSVVSGIKFPALATQASIASRRVVADIQADVNNPGHPDAGRDVVAAGTGTAVVHVEIADVTGPIRPDTVNGTVTASLTNGRAQGFALDQLDLDATMASGLATVTRLEVTGPAARVSASGALALEGQGESDLGYRVAVLDLSAFNTIAGRPLRGTADIEGRVTGPARATTAAGMFRANSLEVATVRALAVNGTYEGTVPDNDFRRTRGRVDASGTFVEIGDTDIDSFTARVNYNGPEIDVEGAIHQQRRTATFAGALIPHPDHREIHIRNLAVTAGTTEWRTVEGREAVAQYGAKSLVIRGLELTRAEARVRVEGALGGDVGAADPLTVSVERVRLEDINTILLSTQQLAGQVDGTARITGDLSHPVVDADLSITDGTVGAVAFETLTGKAHYASTELGLDMRLEAGTSGRLTATGTMPLKREAGTTGTNGPVPAYNLTLESTAINLALFQPLLSHLEQLQGLGAFDLRVSGPADAPSLQGSASVAGASFTMAATGTHYPRLDARFQADGNVLTVDQFNLHDEDGHTATVAGTLKVSDRGVPQDFNLRFRATDFHVLNNKFGELIVTPDLRIRGDLQSPLVSGTIEVERGRLEVSDILERFGASGYRRAELTGAEKLTAVTAAGPTAGASYSIALDFADNLVVRGRDIRGPKGSIGLGDANLTLGGALTIAKDAGQPVTLQGTLEVVRGNYTFQGRRFTILPESTLRFRKEDSLNPDLEVGAERQIGGVTAHVRVTGTIGAPEVALSSSPPLDQGDILSLIVFNQTMNTLPTAQRVSLATRAGTLAARALATPIADSVAKALDFDVFEITPTEDVSGGAIVTIGRQVSDRLFVGFRQQFGSEDVSQVSFEYRLTEFLKVVTAFAQGAERARTGPRTERAGADFIFVIRR